MKRVAPDGGWARHPDGREYATGYSLYVWPDGRIDLFYGDFVAAIGEPVELYGATTAAGGLVAARTHLLENRAHNPMLVENLQWTRK
jgi:hypothetical protein